MPEPGALPLGVLSRVNGDVLHGLRSAQRTTNEITDAAIARGIPRRRIVIHQVQERTDLRLPAGSEHGLHAAGDTPVQRRSGIDYKISRLHARRATGALVPDGDRYAGQERDFNGAQQLRTAEMRAWSIQLHAPASERVG